MSFFGRLVQLLVLVFFARRVAHLFGGSRRSGDGSPQVKGYPETPSSLDLKDVEDAVFEDIEEN